MKERSLAAQAATVSGRQARDDRVRQDTEVADYVVLRSLRCEPALKNERPASLPSRGRRAARSEAGGTKRNRVYLCLPAAGRGTSPLCVTNGIWWREKGRCGGAKRESGAARDETQRAQDDRWRWFHRRNHGTLPRCQSPSIASQQTARASPSACGRRDWDDNQ